MESIAIIGLACRFPGATNSQEFWTLLQQGRDAITEVPPNRWDWQTVYHPTPATPGKMNTRWGGFLPHVDQFDAAFFGISRREAERIDPQQRLLLEVTWEAFEQAAIVPATLAGSATGVFIGISNSDYSRCLSRHLNELDAYSGTGTALCIAANRLSFLLNLRGPSLAIDTACSSSLVAVHLACQSLQNGESDLAIAGGVNLILSPELTVIFSQAHMMAADGRCKTFDASADGYVRSEGCGVVLLKRLSAAQAAGDRILAVIQGSAVNQDGLTNGLTAPNGPAQQRVIQQALTAAGVAAREISYVEAHGTGTILGDPIEVNALTAVLQLGRSSQQRCAIGSVKTNIGHLESAAGIAGLIKVVLALQHRYLPPHLHLNQLNPHIQLETPFFIPTEGQVWALSSDCDRRLAGVSAFSFGGTNAHVILAEAPETPDQVATIERPWQLLSLSAKQDTTLIQLAKSYQSFLATHPDVSLANLCHTANTGRSHFEHRLTIVTKSTTELQKQLKAFSEGKTQLGTVQGQVKRRKRPKLAFLFTGQGSQAVQMGRQLYETQPTFRHILEQCDAILHPYLDRSLLSILYPETNTSTLLQETRYAQPALFAIEYALAELWRSWGVVPDVVMGHSLGEYVAACIAGVFCLEDGLKLVAERSQLMQSLPKDGAMAAIFASADVVGTALPATETVTIAVFNNSQNTVISGTKAAVQQVVQQLESAGIRSRWLQVSHAFHSPQMEPILDVFEQLAQSVTFAPPQIPLISNLTGTCLETAPDACYWRSHLREPVQFATGLHTLAAQFSGLWLEVSVHSTLLTIAKQDFPDAVMPWLPSLERGQEDWQVLLTTLATLSVQGYPVDWAGFDRDYPRQRIELPTYPFERERFWFESSTIQPTPAAKLPIQPEASSPMNDRLPLVRTQLQQLVAQLLKAQPDAVNIHAPLLEMGADSIVLVEAVQAIEQRFGIQVTIRQFFEELNTIDALAQYIAQSIPSQTITEVTALPAVEPQLTRHQRQLTQQLSDAKNIAVPSTSNSLLEQVITQQLQLMSQQLELLRTPTSSVSPPSLPSTPPVPPPSLSSATAAFTPQQQAHLQALIDRYTRRTAASKCRKQESHPVLADSRACAGFRLSTKEMVYPIVGARSQGSRFWDIDGNEYIDITMGFGVHLFGHGASFITEALQTQIQQGIQIGPQSEFAGEVAQLICDMTGMERVTFTQSGTEAVMTALRLARTATGRTKIARFTNAYHGHFDGVLAIAQTRDQPFAIPLAPGIAPKMVEDVLVLDYGTAESLEILRSQAHELAAVLVEPVQSRNPNLQPRDFLQELRQITTTSNTALIFDEIITGFRVHPGGAQAWFGVQADLATYGKVLGGGMPIGVVAGRSRFMDGIDGGAWQYGDASYPAAERTFFAGTFCKPPLALAAARAVLLHLKQHSPALQQQLNQRTAQLAETLNTYFQQEAVPIQVAHFGSLFRFIFSDNLDLFFYHLIDKGIYVWEGRTCFLSTAHTDEDIQRIIQVVQDSVQALRTGGFLPEKPSSLVAKEHHIIPLTEGQQEIWLLSQMQPEASLAYNESLTLELRGELNLNALQQSLQQLVDRHESLRTAICEDGSGQQILSTLKINLPITDLTHLSSAEQSLKASQWLQTERQQPFDLTQAPLLRVQLLKLAHQKYWLTLTAHHILVDGWSTQVLLREIGDLYQALCQNISPSLPTPTQFQDYIQWQTEQQSEVTRSETYWMQQFTDSFPITQLPIDYSYSATSHFTGAQECCEIEPTLYTRIKQLSNQKSCTVFMTLLSSFVSLIHHLTQQTDFTVGISIAGQASKGHQLVGHCVNVLPLRYTIEPEQLFTDLLIQTQSRVLQAYEHQHYSVSRLARKQKPLVGQRRSPLITTLFNLDQSLTVPNLGDVDVAVVPNPPQFIRWDLTWNLTEVQDALRLECSYNTSLFHSTTIQRWLFLYQLLLEMITEQSQFSLAAIHDRLTEVLQKTRIAQETALINMSHTKLEEISRKLNQR
jgi:acyl transferase domain-containing protein